jgi:hydrogenase maturation protease
MAAERAQHILVIGIGNAESGDDGVGLAVAERVSGLGLSKVDVAKHCGDACALMEAWEGYGNVILVDATRSGAMAGQCAVSTLVRCRRPDALSACRFTAPALHGRLNSHERLIACLRAAVSLPSKANALTSGRTCRPRKSALDEVLEQITAQIARMRATIGTESDG